MKIKIWGARGSIPTSGQKYLLYGGHTTCLEILGKNNEHIIIDAGSGIINAGENALHYKNKELYIFFTHYHWDHIIGFPFFKPLYNKNFNIKIYGHKYQNFSLEDNIEKLMSRPNFPIKRNEFLANVSYHDTPNNIKIGNLEITTVPISHPEGGYGYSIKENNKKFVFLTDNELSFMHNGLTIEDYIKFSKNADLLIHDATFTEEEYLLRKKWGHSFYIEAIELAIESNAKKVGLFHHEPTRTDIEINKMVNTCKKIISERGLNLKVFAAKENQSINI